MDNNSPQDVLLAVIDKALMLISEGKQAKASHILPYIYESVLQYPSLLWENMQCWKIAKIFMTMHHYDLVDDEDEEIEMLQKALVFSQRAIELCEKNQVKQDDYFHALHTQVMLYSSCADYFETTIVEFFSKPKMTEEEIAVARRMAGKVSPMLYYNTLVQIDDNFENFNDDEFLVELCNDFELSHEDITPAQLESATKIHKMLIHKYLELLKQ